MIALTTEGNRYIFICRDVFQNSFVCPVSSRLIKLHETLRTGLFSDYLLGGGGLYRPRPQFLKFLRKMDGSLNCKLVICKNPSKSQFR